MSTKTQREKGHTNRPRVNRAREKFLHIRIDEKTKFALSWMAAKHGLTLTQWLDERIREYVSDPTWEAYWHPSEHVRDVLRIRYGRGRGPRDEDLALFLREYSDLLFNDMNPRAHVIDRIWPKLDSYLLAYKSDPDKARKLIVAAIKSAK